MAKTRRLNGKWKFIIPTVLGVALMTGVVAWRSMNGRVRGNTIAAEVGKTERGSLKEGVTLIRQDLRELRTDIKEILKRLPAP